MALYLHPISDPDKLCQTDARIRSLIFAGYRPWTSAVYFEIAASSSMYVGRPGFAFRCYGWMRTPSNQEESRRGHICKADAQNDIWDRIQRPVDRDRLSGKEAIEIRLHGSHKRPFRHASERPYPTCQLSCRCHIRNDGTLLQIAREVLSPFNESLHTGCRMVGY